ncbi:hypothetical protein QYF36_021381 [Acer negundo]|nr:hypothetical protein QYF36_021381 [Acer negundo]
MRLVSRGESETEPSGFESKQRSFSKFNRFKGECSKVRSLVKTVSNRLGDFIRNGPLDGNKDMSNKGMDLVDKARSDETSSDLSPDEMGSQMELVCRIFRVRRMRICSQKPSHIRLWGKVLSNSQKIKFQKQVFCVIKGRCKEVR